jgi:ABC-type multidrug transport system permease subunit
MKSTKLMLAVIATFVLTSMFLGGIGYLLSDLTYKQCMQHPALLFGMLVIGWIPSVIVAMDLEEHA